jgi:hypothetical protein
VLRGTTLLMLTVLSLTSFSQPLKPVRPYLGTGRPDARNKPSEFHSAHIWCQTTQMLKMGPLQVTAVCSHCCLPRMWGPIANKKPKMGTTEIAEIASTPTRVPCVLTTLWTRFWSTSFFPDRASGKHLSPSCGASSKWLCYSRTRKQLRKPRPNLRFWSKADAAAREALLGDIWLFSAHERYPCVLPE